MANALVDLTDLASVKSYLGLTALTLPSDAFLASVITGVSQQLQSFINRNLVSQAYSVVLDGWGSDRIGLPNTPITAVASLAINDIPVLASTTSTQCGYVFSATQILLRGQTFCRGVQNIALTYTGGFAAIPQDVVEACWEGISAVLNALQRDPTIRSEKAGDTGYTYGGNDLRAVVKLCLTANVTSVLNQYTRRAPV